MSTNSLIKVPKQADGPANGSNVQIPGAGIQHPLQPSQIPQRRRKGGIGKIEEASYIMGTNDSSIVSKRAVEYAYYPKPHFFRYFVQKRKSRAPLINRGYWLRMKCIEGVLLEFLKANSSKEKVILNLGAGFDPLAFQTLSKFPDQCQMAKFVDVDYLDLIRKKCEIIRANTELSSLAEEKCDGIEENTSVRWRSDHYIALSCDLNDPSVLQDFLAKEFDRSHCSFLVISEVAMCYMDVDKADRLLQWIGGIGNVQFCLLEQFLPHGNNHPFADTMLNHFHKVKSPLKSILFYPTLQNQKDRFLKANWSSVKLRSLWELWSDDTFIGAEQRACLNLIEPFDEWEDLALFASHYFLLVAENEHKEAIHLPSPSLAAGNGPLAETIASILPARIPSHKSAMLRINRRFGAIYEAQKSLFSYHGGYGDQTRVGTTISFISDQQENSKTPTSLLDIEPRMCHTITTLNDRFDCLLAGGRTSPTRALSDCWLQDNGVWKRVEQLPKPLYRHCAVRVMPEDGAYGVLVFGGRSTDGKPSSSWYLWQPRTGWKEIATIAMPLSPRFGAAMAVFPEGRHGLLIGGMGEDGTVIAECCHWTLSYKEEELCVEMIPLSEPDQIPAVIYRFGACLVYTPIGFALVGGIGRSGIPRKEDEILRLPEFRWHCADDIKPFLKLCDLSSAVPFLSMGHCVIWDGRGITSIGGGATCFSFGNYVNPFIWRVDISSQVEIDPWKIVEEKRLEHRSATAAQDTRRQVGSNIQTTRSIEIALETDFQRVVVKGQPAVFHGLDIGSCTETWTPLYLLEKIGADRRVCVHKTAEDHMFFQPGQKSFSYADCSFQDFIDSIRSGGKEYFRALSGKGHDAPANFQEDFGELATEFHLPLELAFVNQHFHSSVLRISGPVSMWLHYDVMANVLCQIYGNKRLLLFPPSDVGLLDVPAGSSSSRLNVFEPGTLEGLKGSHPQEVILRPGEILFIPPLWFHAAAPTDDTSIAVNVFFRDLESGYSPGRDVYGNRDLQAYEDGRKDVARLTKRFSHLPKPMANFYLRRLGREIDEEIARLGR